MLTISPAANLEDGDYNITVPAAAVESLQAVPLAADYSFSFTTSPPVQYTLTVIKVGNGMVTPDVGDHLFDEGNGSPPGRQTRHRLVLQRLERGCRCRRQRRNHGRE